MHGSGKVVSRRCRAPMASLAGSLLGRCFKPAVKTPSDTAATSAGRGYASRLLGTGMEVADALLDVALLD